MSRTTQAVFDAHVEALYRKDIEGIMRDFSPDAVYINSHGIAVKGKDEIRKIYLTHLKSMIPGTKSTLKQVMILGDIVFLEWASDSPKGRVDDGVDTFVIRDGLIMAQTAKYTEVVKPSP